jgi:copper transport protein
MRSILAAVAAILLLVFAGPPAAMAHAVLLETAPREGAVVPSAPGLLELRFNEPVSPLALRLVSPDGSIADLPTPAGGDRLSVTAPDLTARGTYLLSWRVVSIDGHPVAGTLSFSIGAPSAVALPFEEAGPGVRPLLWLARLAVYAGLLGGVGTAFAAAIVIGGIVPPWTARLRAGCALTGLAGAVALLGLQGLDALALPLSALASSLPWRTAVTTSAGPAMLLAACACLLAFRLPGERWRGPAVIVALLLAAGSLAVTGHASSLQPGVLFRPAVALHAVAAMLWAGGLLPLLDLARRDDADPALPAGLRRFSSAALPGVAVLAMTGGGLAVAQLESPAGLLTPYGLILLAKLSAVTALLGLAALNRFRLSPAVARNEPGARRRLARSLIAEILLMAVVAGLVAGWRFTPPPRALAAAAAAPRDVAVHVHTAEAMADVTVVPGRSGPNVVRLVLLTGDFGALDAKGVRISLAAPGGAFEAVQREAVRQPDGSWAVEGVPLPIAGRWTMRLSILVMDYDRVSLEAFVDIAR